jgi:hypothetical protein
MCGLTKRQLAWDYDAPPECCGLPMQPERGPNPVSAVHGDEIDFVAKHGVCNDDGSPRRYRSKTELRKAEREKGWTRLGETPNSNPNRWI